MSHIASYNGQAKSDKYKLTVEATELDLQDYFNFTYLTDKESYIKDMLDIIDEGYFILDNKIYFKIADIYGVFNPHITLSNIKTVLGTFISKYNYWKEVLNYSVLYVSIALWHNNETQDLIESFNTFIFDEDTVFYHLANNPYFNLEDKDILELEKDYFVQL